MPAPVRKITSNEKLIAAALFLLCPFSLFMQAVPGFVVQMK